MVFWNRERLFMIYKITNDVVYKSENIAFEVFKKKIEKKYKCFQINQIKPLNQNKIKKPKIFADYFIFQRLGSRYNKLQEINTDTRE